jgi:circadian clock protein KaiC
MHRRPASQDHGRYQERGGNHSKDIREYEITSKGVVIMGDRLTDYQGLITGIPEHLNRSGNNQERSHKSKAKSKS